MDQDLARRIGAHAREARKRLALTQADIAEQLGIAEQSYGRLERGTKLPSVDTLLRMSQVLRTSADALLGLERGAPVGQVAEPPPSYDLPSEVRRLVRRSLKLDARRQRLLAQLAEELAEPER